jgi:hypothetical protein
MMHNMRRLTAILATTAVALPAAPIWAVPYASGVRNTAGAAWEFVLNEAADNVTVLRNGGNAVNLGGLAAGRHAFDMTGFSTFSIEVSKSAAAGWTSISDPTNLFNNFTIPSGLAINKDAASPYFGTVYVASGSATTTERGRAVAPGVYSLTSDMKGVNLASNFAVVADPNDITQAKAPGFTAAGGNVSPWRMNLDAAGNLIISDWSDPTGGLKYASPNLTSGGLVLEGEGGTPETAIVHGSISGKAYVTGSIGNGLVVQAIDEDLAPFNGIWRWDVGNATAYNQPPTSVIDGGALDAISTWISSVNGVRAGSQYSPQHNKWYLVQNRSNGNEAGILVVEPGVDGFSPTVAWDSLTFSNDPNGDFDTSDALDGSTTLDGLQDVFRNIGDVTLSPDGTKLYVHRIAARGPDNPYVPGAVIAIPLDANGVPAIDATGGTLNNVETITTVGNDLGHSSGAQLEFDAAGNLYVANSGVVAGDPNGSAQWVQVFSPGGNTKATTTSAGAFSVTGFTPPANNADFNNDGVVDGADFLVWQKGAGLTGQPNKSTGDATGDGNVDGADLAQWAAKFGGAPAAAAAGAVPEPASLAAALCGAIGLAGIARRRSA